MKHTIQQERLMKVMKKYFYDLYPDFELPFTIERTSGKGNSGYGSGLDDYTYYNISYLSEDGEPWFIKYDDRYNHTMTKWSVTDKIQPIYDFFGDEAVEMFVEWFFGLNIRNKGTKEYNWLIA